jgi:hypothetical protein
MAQWGNKNWRGVRIEQYGMRRLRDLTDGELHTLCLRPWPKFSYVGDCICRELRLREE